MIKPIKLAIKVKDLQDLLNYNFNDLEDRKVDKSEGQGLSTNDFSDFYKDKLDNIEAMAQVNIIESISIDGDTLSISSDKNIDIHQPKYSIAESNTPGEKSLKEYNLTIDGEATGMTIVVPKDVFLSKGYLKKVTALDEPYSGARINDAYLQLDLNDSDIPPVYVSLTGLQYHGGQDIVVDENNVISTVIPIPRKLSELQNDNFTVTDEYYVHTDNNFTDEYISKITNLEIEVDSNFSKLDNKITTLDSKVNTNKVETDTIIQQNYEGLSKEIAVLNAKVDVGKSEIDTTIQQNYNILNDKITTLDSKVDKNKAETDTAIQQNYNDLDSKISALETTTNGSLSDIEESIENLNSAKADKATTLLGYGISDAYTKTEVDAKVSSVYRVRGSVATYDDLLAIATETIVIGDVYNVIDSGANYVWIGDSWDKLSETVDLTPYLTKESASETYATIVEVNSKVDKVEGKSLILDTEIERLATLKNYDDTELQASILRLDSDKQDKLIAGDNITISENTISSSTTWGDIQGDIQNQVDLTTELDSKVDKVEGKSLILDTEIERLANLENYDDTEVRAEITSLENLKQDKLITGDNITISENTISSSTTWGDIQGDIQNQVDLTDRLVAKLDKNLANSKALTNCILSAPNGVATSSGGTVTVKAGLKALFSNGRNADKTLKNMELTLTNGVSFLLAGSGSETRIGFLHYRNGVIGSFAPLERNYFKQAAEPADNGQLQVWYNPDTNIFKWRSESSAWTALPMVEVCKASGNSTNVTALEVNQPVELCTTNTTQTITGAKTFANGHISITGSDNYQSVNCKNSEADYANLRANQRGARLISFDKNNQHFGYFQTFTDDNNALRSIINVTRKLGGQIKSAAIEVQINTSGNTFGAAPTYTANYADSSNKIVTTAYMANHWGNSKAVLSKARPAVVVQCYTSGAFWYRVWSDGWIEQGGQNDGTAGAINFMKPFSNAEYGLQVTCYDAGNLASASFWNPTKTGFILHSTSNFQCRWYACGY